MLCPFEYPADAVSKIALDDGSKGIVSSHLKRVLRFHIQVGMGVSEAFAEARRVRRRVRKSLRGTVRGSKQPAWASPRDDSPLPANSDTLRKKCDDSSVIQPS